MQRAHLLKPCRWDFPFHFLHHPPSSCIVQNLEVSRVFNVATEDIRLWLAGRCGFSRWTPAMQVITDEYTSTYLVRCRRVWIQLTLGERRGMFTLSRSSLHVWYKVRSLSDRLSALVFASDQVGFLCPDIADLSVWVAVVTMLSVYTCDAPVQHRRMRNGHSSSHP